MEDFRCARAEEEVEVVEMTGGGGGMTEDAADEPLAGELCRSSTLLMIDSSFLAMVAL